MRFQWLKRPWCWIRGHDPGDPRDAKRAIELSPGAGSLYRFRCAVCGGRYVGNRLLGNGLLPDGKEWDEIFLPTARTVASRKKKN